MSASQTDRQSSSFGAAYMQYATVSTSDSQRSIMIKLFIVDDHQVFRNGLRMLIDSVPDMELVGEAESSKVAFEKLGHIQPDLILMDIQMPEESGIDLTARVKKRFPNISVLILTMFDDEQSILAAQQAGACGFLLKGINHKQMLHAIRAAV